jgi:single-stranded DNA-specific DHH superfamily exonuclease
MSAEIKNLRKVAERIKKAIQKGEKIVLYGDAD